MRNILFFSNNFDECAGGMEVHRSYFIKFFKAHQDFSLYLLGKQKGQYTVISAESSKVFASPEEVIADMQTFTGHNDLFFFNDLWWIEDVPALRKRFKHNKFILRSGGNDILRAPILEDGVDLRIRQSTLVDLINKNIDRLIVNSDYSYFVNVRLGIEPLIMKKVRGGVDLRLTEALKSRRQIDRAEFDKLYCTENKILIAIVCRFVPFKGVSEFLQKIECQFDYRNWVLLVVGNGPKQQEVAELLERFYPHNHVLITGADNAEALRYISVADCLINPSLHFERFFGSRSYIHTETMGRSMMEAVSLNVPVIASNVGGTRELFAENERGIGLLVEDFHDFAANLQHVICQKTDAPLAKDYSWERVFSQYIDNIFSDGNKKVYCLDVDGTIIDCREQEETVAEKIAGLLSDDILILNTARHELSEIREFAVGCHAKYVIYDNGCKIAEMFSHRDYNDWNEYDDFSRPLDVLYNDLVQRFKDYKIERTHRNCISAEKKEEAMGYIKTVLDKSSPLEILEGGSCIKVLSRFRNKKQALLYVLKDISYSQLITAGNATNDLPFVSLGDEAFIEEELSRFVECRCKKTFRKQTNKEDILMRIFRPRVIVSLTSFPQRMEAAKKAIASLHAQSICPDRIVLYLSAEEFAGEGKHVPDMDDIQIEFVDDNLLGHKKYFHAFREYPNDIIITVDDDIYYDPKTIEKLLEFHEKYPHAVIANRTRFITFKDAEIQNYYDWEKNYPADRPSMLLMGTGVLGILYPPRCFDNALFDVEAIKKYALHNDDIWLKCHEIIKKIPTVLTDSCKDLHFIEGTQKDALCSKNFHDNGCNTTIKTLFGLYKIDARTLFAESFTGKEIYRGRNSVCCRDGNAFLIKHIAFQRSLLNEYEAFLCVKDAKVDGRKFFGYSLDPPTIVYNYIVGVPYRKDTLDAIDYGKVIDYIAILQSKDCEHVRSWDEYRDDCIQALRYYDPYAQEEAEMLNAPGQHVLIHGDLNPNNILVQDGVFQMIDYENCCAGPDWWDRCYFLANFDRDRVSEKIIKSLTQSDIKRVELIIKIRLGRSIRKGIDTCDFERRLRSWVR